MPRKRKPVKNNRRKKRIVKWTKRYRQKGGFVFSLSALGAAIYAGIKGAAIAGATGAIGSAAGYATNKLLSGKGRRRGRGYVGRTRKRTSTL